MELDINLHYLDGEHEVDPVVSALHSHHGEHNNPGQVICIRGQY